MQSADKKEAELPLRTSYKKPQKFKKLSSKKTFHTSAKAQ